MNKELSIGNNGTVANEVYANYMPSKEVRDITAAVQYDYMMGSQLLNKPRPEYNDRSVRDEMNINQMSFNSYIPPRSQDPDDDWRAQTVRPLTRNKIISIAAHVTQEVLFPNVFAQNDRDDEDKAAAMVMRDLIEWAIYNSAYVNTFLMAVITALVDPAVIVEARFAEVIRKIKELKEDGTYTLKEVVDDVMSGFQFDVVPANQLLISNIYEPNIQKQRFVIKTKLIDYKEAQMVYGHYENFKYVQPGAGGLHR